MKQNLELLIDANSKKLVFRCDAPDIKRLKRIALDNDTTLNALLLEGVNYILRKYEGKSQK